MIRAGVAAVVRGALVACLPVLVAAIGCDERVGTVCGEDRDCGGDLVCARAPAEPDGGEPAQGVCTHARRARGAECNTTAECAPGLFCSNDLPAAEKQRHGSCIDVQPADFACFRDENCADGLVCVKPDGAESGQCGAPP